MLLRLRARERLVLCVGFGRSSGGGGLLRRVGRVGGPLLRCVVGLVLELRLREVNVSVVVVEGLGR
jgi:hypothetical protein